VLSFQLAHIVLGHHIDTRYAFNDRLLFPDEATFERIHMSHSDPDNELAAKKAVDLLNHSVYANQLAQPGLFLAQLDQRSNQLTALNTPRLGDSLLRPTGEPWLNALMPKAQAGYEQAGSDRGPAPGQPIEDRCLGRQGHSLERQAGSDHERAG
jgi:hypothetical protein